MTHGASLNLQQIEVVGGCSWLPKWGAAKWPAGWVFSQARLAPRGWVSVQGHMHDTAHAQQHLERTNGTDSASGTTGMAVAHRAVSPHLGSLARSSTTSSTSWGMRSGHSHTAAPRLRRVAACRPASESEHGGQVAGFRWGTYMYTSVWVYGGWVYTAHGSSSLQAKPPTDFTG